MRCWLRCDLECGVRDGEAGAVDAELDDDRVGSSARAGAAEALDDVLGAPARRGGGDGGGKGAGAAWGWIWAARNSHSGGLR